MVTDEWKLGLLGRVEMYAIRERWYMKLIVPRVKRWRRGTCGPSDVKHHDSCWG
jgi:hypothetical protein